MILLQCARSEDMSARPDIGPGAGNKKLSRSDTVTFRHPYKASTLNFNTNILYNTSLSAIERSNYNIDNFTRYRAVIYTAISTPRVVLYNLDVYSL